MNIPDFISPIVAYRAWHWDSVGLRSLNNELWFPGQPLAASCRRNQPSCHQPPCLTCTCGVYAAKNFQHLRNIGYAESGIHGETYLWGTVVEHTLGYRAQFAYPKSIVLPHGTIPFKLTEAESRLQTLMSYGVELLICKAKSTISLWSKESGFNAAAFDYLIGVHKRYYEDCLRERVLKQGDRVALLGKGIALVVQAGDCEICLALHKKIKLRVRRKDVVWNRQNMRWEAEPGNILDTT